MRKLTLLTTLTFSLMFSSVCFGEWEKVVEDENETSLYVDFERIKQHDGYVYYWDLVDYVKPSSDGFLSGTIYNQVDCSLFRLKRLSVILYKESMGQGESESFTLPDKDKWYYTSPDSTGETTLQSVCGSVKSWWKFWD